MKRTTQLQPLSRQHHLGLNIARHAKDCLNDTQDITKHAQALSAYLHDMQPHFDIEDELLASALLPHKASHAEVAAALETLEQQHTLLYHLSVALEDAQTADNTLTVVQVQKLATLLYAHIRFEERELLPIAEKYLTEDELNAIYAASPDSSKRLDEGR